MNVNMSVRQMNRAKTDAVPRFTVLEVSYGSTRLQPPWSISVNRSEDSTLYVILGNGAWFEAPALGLEPFWCPPGSSMSVSFGIPHIWRSDLSQPATTPVDSFPLSSPRLMINTPSVTTQETTMLVGRMPASNLRVFLPINSLLYVPPEAETTIQRLLKILSRIDIALSEESNDFSTEAIIQRLSEMLVIENTRYWMKNAPDRAAYPLIGMEDRHIYSALMALHRQLDRKWTTDQLAAEASLSRSAFAVRFKRLTGMAPLEYLTVVRLRRAAYLMSYSRSTLAGIALSVGYRSEAAFIRAFRREFKMTPGEYKRRSPPVSRGAPYLYKTSPPPFF
jgi:AraC-like DNA-binding protein